MRSATLSHIHEETQRNKIKILLRSEWICGIIMVFKGYRLDFDRNRVIANPLVRF